MKTAVITGGNSGMGKAAAIELAKLGYRVIIHGRNAEKARQAAEEIKVSSGNENVEHIPADVSEIKGMKALAAAIKQRTTSIDVLILSTGVILPNHVITTDGLEAGFAIQYLSRFTVVQLLMDELKKGNARIVMIAAPKMKSASIHFEDIALKNNFTMIKAMGQEMFANHLLTQEFAKRNPGSDVVMNIMHVGIARTGIMREANFFLKMLVALFGKSPRKLTENIIYLATSKNVNFSGYFLKKPGRPSVREKVAYDPEVSEKLWNKSLEWIG
jgi:retinol dehydrogenase-14